MNKVFAIFKANEKKSDKSPDYKISMKVGDKYVEIGGAWLKEGKGGKFFSCKLSNSYGERKGYHLTEDAPLTDEEITQLDAARAGEATKVEVNGDQIPF